MSVTSSTSASALSPRARIASAPCSISVLVRAASVTCAPAAASADAAASPMPRPPPVTSARLPSRRNDGALVSSTVITSALYPSLRRLCVWHIAAAVAADADIGLLRVCDEALEHAQPRAGFADLGAGLICSDPLIGAGLEKLADP